MTIEGCRHVSYPHPRHRSGPAPHRLGARHDRGHAAWRSSACGTVASNDKHALAERLQPAPRRPRRGRCADLAPDEVAVEETFVNKDAQATLKLGHARGIALFVPALAGLPVAEYAANLVKKTVVGAGHAEKRQIQAMVRVLLPKADPASDDAADALAIAITHAHHRKARALVG